MGMTMEASWHHELKKEIAKPYISQLKAFLAQERAEGKIVYPPEHLVFSALSHTPFDQVKVVIVGQDPYHGEGQAHGLSFSVPSGVRMPPSLKNIFHELVDDVGISFPKEGCLTKWATQGVLMLNATLTVRAGEPRSHYGKGWEQLTDAMIAKLAQRTDPIVFMLWGKSAQEKCEHVLKGVHTQHAVLTAPHPSPYSAHTGFLGCQHFSKTNTYLQKWGKIPIDWSI